MFNRCPVTEICTINSPFSPLAYLAYPCLYTIQSKYRIPNVGHLRVSRFSNLFFSVLLLFLFFYFYFLNFCTVTPPYLSLLFS